MVCHHGSGGLVCDPPAGKRTGDPKAGRDRPRQREESGCFRADRHGASDPRFAAEQKAEASEAVAVQEREAARHSLARSALLWPRRHGAKGTARRCRPRSARCRRTCGTRPGTTCWSGRHSIGSASAAPVITLTWSVAADPRRPGVFAIAERTKSRLDVRTGVHSRSSPPIFDAEVKAGGYPRSSRSRRTASSLPSGGMRPKIASRSTAVKMERSCWNGKRPPRGDWSSAPTQSSCFRRNRGVCIRTCGTSLTGSLLGDQMARAYIYGGFSPDGKQMVTSRRSVPRGQPR